MPCDSRSSLLTWLYLESLRGQTSIHVFWECFQKLKKRGGPLFCMWAANPRDRGSWLNKQRWGKWTWYQHPSLHPKGWYDVFHGTILCLHSPASNVKTNCTLRLWVKKLPFINFLLSLIPNINEKSNEYMVQNIRP